MIQLFEERILTEPFSLSSYQQEAVLSPASYTRIIAGAGAGKTETLTRRILYLLFCKKVEPRSIVAFTFTEKAATEMKTRVYERVLNFEAMDVYNQLGDMFIGTIHGYCHRFLEEQCGYGSWTVLDENQEMAYLIHIATPLQIIKGKNTTEKAILFKQSLSILYNDLIPEELIRDKAPFFYPSVLRYEKYLDTNHLLTFDRMVVLALSNLKNNPDISRNIQHLIVDEYQDINLAQEALIRAVGVQASIFVVGDPRQTIYQWRGSDEGCFERFSEIYSNVHDISLPVNRRSTKKVVNLANTLARHFRKHGYEPMVGERKEEGSSFLLAYPDPVGEAEGIVDLIETLVSKGCCRYSDIAILLRSVQGSGTPFIDQFRRFHIPFTLSGQIGLFKRREILALGKFFAWIVEKGFFPKTVQNRKETISGEELLDSGIEDWLSVVPSDQNKESLSENIRFWKERVIACEYPSITGAFYNLLSILGFHALSPDNPEHSVMMGNMASFGKVLSDFESSHHIGGRISPDSAFFSDLFWYLYLYAFRRYEETAGERSVHVDAVTLSTVHQAKGLEWPIVFIPALVVGTFPSFLTGTVKDWLIPRDLFDVSRYEGNTEGERQLFYVSVTRARDQVILSYYDELYDRQYETSTLPSLFVDEVTETDEVTYLVNPHRIPLVPSESRKREKEILSFSAKDLILFRQCPYRYRLNKEWGFLPGLSPDLGYGNALHTCLGEIAIRLRNYYSVQQAVREVVDTCFFLPYANKSRFEVLKQAATKKLLSFATEREQDLRLVRETEYRIEYPVRNGTIIGKIDVMLEHPSGCEIRDYKTSDEVMSPEEAAMQIKIYAFGMHILGKSISSGSVAYIEDARVDPVPVRPEELDGIRQLVEGIIDEITVGKFPAKPGKQCERCDYFQICRYR
jgi:DNA helicase-2/ATP-dependent DNA helicase PcrA